MKITEEQMQDYMFCPAYYEMKHVRKIDFEEKKSMNKLLSKISNYFYLNLLDKTVVSVDDMKKRWDKICEKNQDYIDAKKNLAGISFIINLYKYAAENLMVVLDVNTGYSIVSNNIELVGANRSPFIAGKAGKTELFVADFGAKTPEDLKLSMDLKLTTAAYSFYKRYGKNLDGIKVFYAKKGTVHTTTRNEMDYKRLLTTIDGVGRAIKEEAFYARENVLCESCVGKQYCKYWHR